MTLAWWRQVKGWKDVAGHSRRQVKSFACPCVSWTRSDGSGDHSRGGCSVRTLGKGHGRYGRGSMQTQRAGHSCCQQVEAATPSGMGPRVKLVSDWRCSFTLDQDVCGQIGVEMVRVAQCPYLSLYGRPSVKKAPSRAPVQQQTRTMNVNWTRYRSGMKI